MTSTRSSTNRLPSGTSSLRVASGLKLACQLVEPIENLLLPLHQESDRRCESFKAAVNRRHRFGRRFAFFAARWVAVKQPADVAAGRFGNAA
jgi:hypothetical protein